MGTQTKGLNGGGGPKAELSVTKLHLGINGKVLSHIIQAEQNRGSVFQGSNLGLGRLTKESVSTGFKVLRHQCGWVRSDSYSGVLAVLRFSMPDFRAVTLLEAGWLLVGVLHSFLMHHVPRNVWYGFTGAHLCVELSVIRQVVLVLCHVKPRVSKAERRRCCTVRFVIWSSPIPQVASPAVAQVTDNPGNLSDSQELPSNSETAILAVNKSCHQHCSFFR